MPEREEHRPRRAPGRALLLALVLFGPVLSGCLGGDETASGSGDEPPVTRPDTGDFAVTSRVLEDRSRQNETPKSPEPDPRLNVTAPWYGGDWWYYESNHSRFMRVIVHRVLIDGDPFYRVRTETGLIGYPASDVMTEYVTPDFRIVNRTTDDGDRAFFNPPTPEIRFLPGDNTYRFNESGYTVTDGTVLRWQTSWAVRVTEAWPLYPMRVAAGTFNASHFRIAAQKSLPDGESALVFKERWYSPDLRADLQFVLKAQTRDAEKFQLVAYRFMGERGGMRLDYLPY